MSNNSHVTNRQKARTLETRARIAELAGAYLVAKQQRILARRYRLMDNPMLENSKGDQYEDNSLPGA